MTLSERLRAMAENAYTRYIEMCRRDANLGEAAKLRLGKFGQAELIAHREASEELGRHIALSEAATMAAEVEAKDAAKAIVQGKPPRHDAWLIERGQVEGQSSPIWWAGDNWTTAAHLGLQFQTKEEAEKYAYENVLLTGIQGVHARRWSVTQHVFVNSA